MYQHDNEHDDDNRASNDAVILGTNLEGTNTLLVYKHRCISQEFLA